jgi:hypothetical protein
MKIKTDFVTNSSSSCYILSLKEEEYSDLMKFLDYFISGGAIYFQDLKDEERESYLNELPETQLNNNLVMVDVSDELGYGLIENTKFKSNILRID